MNIIDAAMKAKSDNEGRIRLICGDGGDGDIYCKGTLRNILLYLPDEYLLSDEWKPEKIKRKKEKTFYMGEFLFTPLMLDIPLGAEVKATFEWEE